MNSALLKPIENAVKEQQDKILRSLISFYQTTKASPTAAGAGQAEAVTQRLVCGIAEIAALESMLDTAKRQVLNSQRENIKIPNPNQSDKTEAR